MMKLQVVKSGAKGKQDMKSGKDVAVLEDGSKENAEERVQRLYNCPGGPLLGWLFDEARKRGHDFKEMAAELGVTYGYIHQLRTGIRNPAHISQEMAEATARYLGCPPIVTKILSGRIKMSDFICSRESEEDVLDRILRQVQEDPQLRPILPSDLFQLPLEAKKVIVLMYGEVAGQDVYGLREVPNMVRWLQRAVVIHDESEFAALHGHRMTS